MQIASALDARDFATVGNVQVQGLRHAGCLAPQLLWASRTAFPCMV